MFKTVKGKVIAGVMAVALVSGGGAALGATDAGAGLKSWYDGQFKKSERSIATDTLKHSAAGFSGFAENVRGLKTDATKGINETRDTETNDATGGINKEARDYISSINAKKAEIQNNIDSEFKKIEDSANRALNATGKGALALAEFDLKRHTGKDGAAALAHLELEIEKQTNKSIGELEWEIRTTKSFLQDKLNEKSGATIAEINRLVDVEISRLLGLITEKTDKLVADQQDLIVKKADELESAAKQTLEAKVIEFMNK